MRDDLVAEEVEIDPFVRRSAFRATEQFSVERARLAEAAHGKREVESGPCHAGRTGIVLSSEVRDVRSKLRRELLRIDGKPVPVTVRLNPRANRLIVKVHPSTGEVTVVAPHHRSLTKALDFARAERQWIAERLKAVPRPVALDYGDVVQFRGVEHVIAKSDNGPAPVWIDNDGPRPVIRVSGRREHAPRRVADFLKRSARKVLQARTHDFAARAGVRPNRIIVRDTTTRWGSCSDTKNLSFSWRLILAPPFVLDYVVAHEVGHLVHMNHGRRFWRLVRELVGDIETPQAWLHAHGTMLHRYAPKTQA